MKRFAVLCGALLLTVALATPAAAAKPVVVWEEDFDWYETIEPSWGWFDCGFPVVYGQYGHEIYREWYDKDGDPLKGLNRVRGVDYFYAEGHPDNKVSGKFSLNVHVSNLNMIEPDIYEWDEKITGNIWGIQIPGVGNVYHEAGNLQQHVVDWEPVELYKQAGRFGFDADALCAAIDPS